VNGSGVVVERYVYDAYGVQTVYNASWSSLGSSAYSMTYGFQGRPLDVVSGDIDNRGRWYSPTLGRPVTVDPIRFWTGDVNFYRWEKNQPTNLLDPSGFAPVPPTRKNDDLGKNEEAIFRLISEWRVYQNKYKATVEVLRDGLSWLDGFAPPATS